MKFVIAHQLPGRIRLSLGRYAVSQDESLALRTLLYSNDNIISAEVSSITGSITITYTSNLETILKHVSEISRADLQNADVSPVVQSEYLAIHIVKKVMIRYAVKIFLPAPIRTAITLYRASFHIKKGFESLFVHKKLAVEVLDAAAITSSIILNRHDTASSIMFLLSISELIESWCKDRARANLANSLALNVDEVWTVSNGEEKLIPTTSLKISDLVIIRTGCIIPVDGTVVSGEAMVNQATMTGEPLAIKRDKGTTVYAGTIVEEGSITVSVTALKNDTRINRIINLINESENYKSELQSKNERLADSIVPYSFLGALGIYLFTGSFAKATSLFFVDYSCAIKLSASLSILNGLHQLSRYNVIVKGGKFLEALAEADTIVFDKTGTLTVAMPTVKEVIPFRDNKRCDVLRLAACLEEHFPHSVARSVVAKAIEEKLDHKEEHSEVEYVIAHGIASRLNGKRVLIGSQHFIFDDENVKKDDEVTDFLNKNEGPYSILYLAIDGELAGIIQIDDPVKPSSLAAVKSFQNLGLKVIMLTGDNEKTAELVAEELSIDEYRSHMLPEDKATFINNLKKDGHKVIMVGDGVNDTPALSCADASVSVKDCSDIAKEVADIQLMSTELSELTNAITISRSVLKRINSNYRFIIGYNSALLLLGSNQIISSGTSAFLHNLSTIGIGVSSIQSYDNSIDKKN